MHTVKLWVLGFPVEMSLMLHRNVGATHEPRFPAVMTKMFTDLHSVILGSQTSFYSQARSRLFVTT